VRGSEEPEPGRERVRTQLSRAQRALAGSELPRKRPVLAEDDELLLEVYRQARQLELQAFGWPEAQLDSFVRMQFRLQQAGYVQRYPEAEHSVVLCEGQAAGQLRVARAGAEMVLVDIGLLERFRGRGIGSALIAELCAEAARRGVELRASVRPDNRALALYLRLGFRELSRDWAQVAVSWRSTSGPGGTGATSS
jgi:ribosomal protein S18 acetylase RimI-like enzyme